MSKIPTSQTNNHHHHTQAAAVQALVQAPPDATVSPFEGFDSSRFVMTPCDFIKHVMAKLSGAEVKVMLYILLRTLGYSDRAGGRKRADAISRSQFLHGIKRADGTVVDEGTGVSEHTLTRALDVLEAEGYIIRHRRTTASGRPSTTIYEVVFQQEAGGSGKAQGAAPTTGAKVTPAKLAPASALTTPPSPNPATSPAADRAELEVSAKIEPDQAIMHPADTAILHPTGTAILHRTKENLKQKKLLIQHTNTQPVEETPTPAESSGGCVCVADKVKELDTRTQTGLQSGIGPELKQILPSVPSVLSKPLPVREEKLEPELKPELTGLVEEFCRQRISQKLALELAPLALANGHGPGYLAQLQAYIATLRGVKNPQGFLIHLVRTNWQPGASAGAWPGSGREPGLGLGAHAGDGGSSRGSGSGSGGEESALWNRTALEARYGPDIVRELPTSVTAEKLPRVLEMYPRMIREATSQRERLGYEAKLERYRLLGRQMGLLAAAPEDQGSLPQPVPVAQAEATPLLAPPWTLPVRPNSNTNWPKNSPTHPFNPAQVQAQAPMKAQMQVHAQAQIQVQGGSYAAN